MIGLVDDEKTLLEQVREKEIDLAAEYDRACAGAEAAREMAAHEARETVERAEREGLEAAEALHEREMADLEHEIERIRTDAAGLEDALRSTGESRISEVADELVGYVAPAQE